ncbi:calcineurin subunit B type 2-like [Symsagittifera roscoffensis]|uniref:calcineurin subunit B type 2-like n=1 Tax=Symsagittifera roscoffensis TaxID=84072 RepID=UPI00307C8636
MSLKTEEELRASFHAFSNHESNRITKDSLKKWCSKHSVSTAHIEEFIKKFDDNRDKEVDFYEFVRYYLREDIEKEFKQYDLNGDGMITRQEIMTVLRRMGIQNQQELQSAAYALMKSVDDNSDGFISYPEFADHFVKQNYSFKS